MNPLLQPGRAGGDLSCHRASEGSAAALRVGSRAASSTWSERGEPPGEASASEKPPSTARRPATPVRIDFCTGTKRQSVCEGRPGDLPLQLEWEGATFSAVLLAVSCLLK